MLLDLEDILYFLIFISSNFSIPSIVLIIDLIEEFEIEDNPMKRIFNECFTEIDRKTLLAYIGCALFDTFGMD